MTFRSFLPHFLCVAADEVPHAWLCECRKYRPDVPHKKPVNFVLRRIRHKRR